MKLLPPAPKSHEVRTTWLRGLASSVARSPAAFERPYSEIGLTGSDSMYGLPMLPSKT